MAQQDSVTANGHTAADCTKKLQLQKSRSQSDTTLTMN